MSPNRRQRVTYDSKGNIILSDTDIPMESVVKPDDHIGRIERAFGHVEPPKKKVQPAWDRVEEFVDKSKSVKHAETQKQREQTRSDLYVLARVGTVSAITRSAVEEGVRQFSYTMDPARRRSMLMQSIASMKDGYGRVRAFLLQPVWIPGRNKELKQYGRGTLFFFDTMRFGATFAAIFGVLFTALNYQSFWQIASAQISTFIEGPSLDTRASDVAAALGGGDVNAIDAQARDRGDLFAYLPPVGPPEDRIIVPKLGLNVPLVQPSTASLLRQDWVGVETDIQTALEGGVVHYPGTARPGQAGNFFVTGHSSYYPWAEGNYKTVFARLHELEEGDEYWVYYGGDKHKYVVRSKREVQPSDVTVLDQPANARMATLMTCTPIGTTLRRLIVKAEEVDPVSNEVLKVGERTHEEKPRNTVQLEALPI